MEITFIISIILFALGIFLGYEYGWRKAVTDMNAQQLQASNQSLWMEMMSNLTRRNKNEQYDKDEQHDEDN